MHRSRAAAVLAVLVSSVAAQTCIDLSESTACPAFSAGQVNTDNAYILGLYPFLQSVTNVQEFDANLTRWVTGGYITAHYVNVFGCDNTNDNSATDYYARYTTSFLCNGMVQNTYSRGLCNIAPEDAVPLCAESCSYFANSESEIVNSGVTCPGRVDGWEGEVRADFTNCALPQNSILNGTCVYGFENEPENCGFGANTAGLCDYCRQGGVNSTDTCCIASNTTGLCEGVTAIYTPISGIVLTSTGSPGSSGTGTTSPNSSPSASGSAGRHGLSGGAIAGIVIGSVFGFLLLLALIIFACIAYRRSRDKGSSVASLNQPSPPRQIGSGGSMVQKPTSAPNPNFTISPGNGRVTRMSAMQSDEESNAGGYKGADPYGQIPGGQGQLPTALGALGAIRLSPRSNGSSGGTQDFSSPDGVASGQSEQLQYFKDYYSNDDIHPNDRVSVLWAYQPRAGDEFELERGDMLKVVGIWDDGWATGVRISDRAEDYDGKGKSNRDSGVSNGSGRRSESPPVGEIKAFPLVCVCLPEVWRKTVEGDTSTDSGSVPI